MNRKFNPRIDKIKVFSKIRTLFSIFKKGRGGLPSPPQLRAGEWSVVEYASISLNMHKYPWKFLNKLFWLCQKSENYWSSDRFGRLLKMSQVLTKPGFWIWHGLYIQGLSRVPYVSIMPEYAWICLNVSQYAWTWLNIADCPWIYLQNAWINCSDYARVLNISRYSYNNIIIIVTNDILLEFLSAQFVHPGALLPFYIFWHNLEHKNNES